MAINKKLIHFKNFSDFNSKKLSANETNTQYTLGISGSVTSGSPDILYQSICYIKDTKQQWTHGQLYDCGKTSNTKEPFYFEVSDIEGLTNRCFDFTNLINAFKEERPIFLRFDTTQSLIDRHVVPVSMTYNEIYLALSFIYYDSIYKINYEVNEETNAYCSTEQTVTKLPIDSIYAKPNAGIPKSDLSNDVQTILNNSLTENDIYDDSFIKANGIVDENDHFYYLPSEANTDPNFTLATKSDINVQAVDTGDVIDDVAVNYATTAYVDRLIGDINSVLESIINGGSIKLISFSIGTDIQCQAEEGMAWSEWVDSEYNTINAFISGSYVAFSGGAISLNNTPVNKDDLILSTGYLYTV